MSALSGFMVEDQRGYATWGGVVEWLPGSGLSSLEALQAAGLDWEVEKVPCYAPAPGEPGDNPQAWQVVPNRYAIRRTDTGAYLTAGVGGQWTSVPNRELFDFGGEVLGGPEAPWVAAGSMRNGGLVYMQARLQRELRIGGDPTETIDPLLTLYVYHDGTGGLGGGVTPVRVVCENTCAMAVGAARAIRLTHRTKISDRLNEARDVLRQAIGYYDAFEQTANELLKVKVTQPKLKTFLEQLIPYAPDADLTKDRAARNREEARDAIRALLANKPDLQNIRGTAWGVLQAVTDYADHDRKTRDTDRMTAEENRTYRILFQTDPLKDRALELLTAA